MFYYIFSFECDSYVINARGYDWHKETFLNLKKKSLNFIFQFNSKWQGFFLGTNIFSSIQTVHWLIYLSLNLLLLSLFNNSTLTRVCSTF